ncbi:MAG: GNAT family N-acetyltransferase [Enterobacteriaceae bacterium]
MTSVNCAVKEIAYQSKEYDEAFALRNLLLRVPLGLDMYTEDLSREVKSVHAAAYIEGEMVGAMNFYEQTPGVYYLQQIVVSENRHNCGIGKKMMVFMEEYLKEKGADKITMNARVSAQKFYDILGYYTVGDVFSKPNFPEQIRMDKDL